MDGITASRVRRTMNSCRSPWNELGDDSRRDGRLVPAVGLHGGAGGVRDHRGRAGGDGVHPDQLPVDVRPAVPRNRFGAVLAVPFFLLVGELMSSANVVYRMISLAQTLVGHLRGGLAQVVTLFSMFFAGISGSSAADVAVLTRTVAPEMDKERYDRAFTAALIASASTMANLIPPSIMAVVYGATGNVSIGGLFLAGVVPGVMIGIGLMIYSYFFGPVGTMKKRARLVDIFVAARGSALPMVIPVIIMGGILSGWFTPTEAGMAAVGVNQPERM